MNSPLNDIILNASMLEDLYGHSLVEIEKVKPAPDAALKFLGNNRKNVTVLVDHAGYAFLPDEHLSFLNKMLAACKMNTGDVAIVNMAGGATLQEAMEQLAPARIIAFGTTVDDKVDPFTVWRFNDALLVQAPALDYLAGESEEARGLKLRLWPCLKNLFGIA